MKPEIEGRGPLARVSRMIADRYRLPLYQGEIGIAPQAWARRILSLLILSIALTLLLATIAALVFLGAIPMPMPMPLTAALAASAGVSVPWLILILLLIRPRLSAMGRRRSCERELPFLITNLAIAAASGMPIQVALDRLRGSAFLGRFRKEAWRIEKVRRLYGIHPYDAMSFEAKHHPSERVRELYFSVVAAQRQGDAVPSVLRDELVKAFAHLQGNLRTISDKFSMIASAEMISFILIPMGVLTLGVVFSPIASLNALLLACMALPTLTAVILSFIIDSSLPRELTTPVDLRVFWLSLASFPAAGLLALLLDRAGVGLPLHYTFGLVLLPSLLAAAAHYVPLRSEVSRILSALPAFTRLVAEEVKKGSSPGMSIVRFSEGRAFNRNFDIFIRRVSTFLKIGMPISEVARAVKAPWIVKAAFELIDDAEKMGAEPKSLDYLSELISSLTLSMRMLSSQTRFFAAVSYINTLVLTFTTVIAVDVIGGLFVGIGNLSQATIALPLGLSFMTASQFELAKAVACVAVVYDAFLLGVLGGKLSGGGSVADGLLPAAACVAISLGGFLIFRELGLVRLIFGG